MFRSLALVFFAAIFGSPALSAQDAEPAPRPLAGSSFQLPGNEQAGQNSTLQAGEPVSADALSGNVVLRNCGVHLIEDVEVPAREAGQLLAVDVREGDLVEPEQMVARIDDQLARRQLEESTFKHEVADSKAKDGNKIETEERKLQLYTEEYEITLKLYQNGNKSETEYRRALATMQIADLDLATARNEQKIAGIDAKAEAVRVQAAQESIERHALISPVKGQVFEIFRQRGEWVSAGDKVMRVARMDRLRVKGRVDGRQHDPAEIAGKPVTVSATLARGRQVQLQGQVTFVALEKVGSAHEFEVWAEVDNQLDGNHWQLLPGSNVEMMIHLQ
jgi:multidrug efflux pump subunit AcrA (membrane-fusion protein)